jgi:hypothetical protein
MPFNSNIGYEKKFGEQKRSAKIFNDGKRRNTKGQYGYDEGVSSSSRSFWGSEFELGIGSFYIGKFKYDIGSSGFAASIARKSSSIDKWVVNERLSRLGDDFCSPEIMANLRAALKKIHCDVDQIVVKDVVWEGPGVGLGISMKTEAFGASASAQYHAARLTLETPTEELVVRVKQGLGAGFQLGLTTSKAGKLGLSEEKKISFASLDIELKTKQDKLAEVKLNVHEPQPDNARVSSHLLKSAKNAEQFIVKQEVSPQTAEAEENRLLEATIEEITQSLPIDGEHAEKMRQQYHQAPSPSQGFIDFQKELKKSPNISSEDIIYASARTAVFLSEVANLTENRELARFSTGLKAVTQGFAGLHEIHSACGLIQSAKTLSLENTSDLLGGAGMVLAGISLLSSLLDEDEEENGLGEALGEIHSSIMNMWGEMREDFQITWEKIEGVHTHLDEIEGNNWKRFNQTMSLLTQTRGDILAAIALIHKDVMQGQKALEFQILDIKQKLFPYLDLLIDMPVKRVILELFKSEMPDIQKKAMEYGNELRLWLTENARSRAGFNLDASQVRFDQLIPLSDEPSDIPLGLFFKLVCLLEPGVLPFKSMPLVNPNHWDKILEVYITVIQIALPDIINKPKEIREFYLQELDLLKSIIDGTIHFFEAIAHSETLFFVLVDQYQKSFLPLVQFLPQLIEKSNSSNDKKILIRTQMPFLIAPIQQSYSHLMGFFHLLDRNYIPLMEPLVITDIQNILRALESSSDEVVDNFFKLLITRLRPELWDLWKEPFEGYLTKGFTLEMLKEHLKRSLLSHPVLLNMRKAQENMDGLIDSVRTEIIEHHETMSELLESAEDLDETLVALSESFHKLQPFFKPEKKTEIQTQLEILKSRKASDKVSFFAHFPTSTYGVHEHIDRGILSKASL